MLYEYELDPNAAKEDMKNMHLNGNVLRNLTNSCILEFAIFEIATLLILVVTFIINDYGFDYIGYIGVFILIECILMIVFVSVIRNRIRKIGAKIITKMLKKHWNEKNIIEIKDDKYICLFLGNRIHLRKEIIMEVIKLEKYTLIFIAAPKFLKYIVTMRPIVVPNSLFGSEEKYNEFISIIS